MYSPRNVLSCFFLKQELPVTGHAVIHQNQGDFTFGFLAVNASKRSGGPQVVPEASR